MLDLQSIERDNWMSRIWRALIALDEAINTSPIELLENRVAALEQEVRTAKERSRTHAELGYAQASSRHRLEFGPIE